MAKEELNESRTDIAYRLLQKSNKKMEFYELWKEVKFYLAKFLSGDELLKIDEDISFFYTNLTLDGRFVNVGDNNWDLRERVKYEDAHVDMNEFYTDTDAINEDDIQAETDEYESTDENDEDSYDDPSGTDADISQYRDQKANDDDEDN